MYNGMEQDKMEFENEKSNINRSKHFGDEFDLAEREGKKPAHSSCSVMIVHAGIWKKHE